jgi:hypothetical protein
MMRRWVRFKLTGQWKKGWAGSRRESGAKTQSKQIENN